MSVENNGYLKLAKKDPTPAHYSYIFVAHPGGQHHFNCGEYDSNS